ncbi:uncharacterized protein LOC132613875 isoform X1 [Lycium barbarum]|uniref:uncharacterized protein LOC132613875 isoform X1 n=1 Tax=Lycium barbarum TaxID=112863 RepID=UPI00293F4B63|nr:uncharacterized protein LOC132613875 isoform X1 [Lycium barbarum]
MLSFSNFLIFGLSMRIICQWWEVWPQIHEDNPLRFLHQKIKSTGKALSAWSRIAFGDFYAGPKRLEVLIRDLEVESISNNTPENRMNLSKAKAEFIRYLKIQEKVKWLEEGDNNSAFFHSVIKEKRKRLNIQKIKDLEGNWVEGTPLVAEAAVKFFSNLFKTEVIEEDSSVLHAMERCVSNEDNISLTTQPDLHEIKDTVFPIDPDSAPSPDGLSGKFYQSTWPIIAAVLHAAVTAFFQGTFLITGTQC